MLIAPDSFKGTFSATEVVAAIGEGVKEAGAVPDLCPVADGGEGTMDLLVEALGGTKVTVSTVDPLGRTIEGAFALLPHDVAIVEVACASGLGRVAHAERDPWSASTLGTGRLICAARDAGARTILVGAGGSATVDGGEGALKAISQRPRGLGAAVVVLCDVQTPWERCASIFGPQKGADPRTVRRLAARLERYASLLPHDPRGVAMTGAAGGLAGGLWAALGAELVPGGSYILDTVAFDTRLQAADCVVTGEGRLDAQSAMGKIVGEVAARASRALRPVHAIVGTNAVDPYLAHRMGFRSILEATTLKDLTIAGRNLAATLRNDLAPRS